jgi:hypothetical protein
MKRGKSSNKKVSKTKKIAEITFEIRQDNLHDVSIHVIQKLIPFGILCTYGDIKMKLFNKLRRLKKKVKDTIIVTLTIQENRRGIRYTLDVGVKV